MGPLLVVMLQPGIEVSLYLIEDAVDLLTKHHSIKFIEHRLLKPLTDAISLEALNLSASVIDVFHGKV